MIMRITGVEQQKKDKNRYSIYLDGEFQFGLYDDTLLKYGLRTGDKLDENKINEIRLYDEYNYGKKIAYSYLSYKQRSRKEIEKKLKSKKISLPSIEKIIDWFTELKYINDDAYAKMLIEGKLRRKPIGKRMLEQKLKLAGIGKESAERAIKENYSKETELKKASELLEKYIKKTRFKNGQDIKGKCYKYLISRGFDGETAQMAWQELENK
jgi:regulatory protein